MKVLFIGATGMLGKPVAKELINAGFDVTLLARDPNKMQALYPGVKIIAGDILNLADVVKAMQGQDVVYLNLSVAQHSKNKQSQPEREGLANIIAAAKQTGLSRIAYLSSLVKNYEGINGFHWWCFKIKHDAVAAVKSSGIPYSIFYPSTFMECLDKQMLKGNKLMLVRGSEFRMWWVAAVDYAKQVAKALQQAGNSNQEYIIQGPEGYNLRQAAKIFVDNYSKKVMPMSAPLGVLKFLGIFSQTINYGAHICEALNKYPEKFDSEKTWEDLGKPVTSLAEYAHEL